MKLAQIKLKRLNPLAPDADRVYSWVNIRIALHAGSVGTPNSRNKLFFRESLSRASR